ncbi:MAG: hypothetical protein UT13_C0001G0187 [Candidatus Pacebacteria bacterium GW2011_GWF2_38_9]|nr:MAG: hypothetical protein US01_C0001G0189 [candidate division TM6 bacterium GW2011_GWF2_28_16]KKQ09872.1 MAG: hypothetical protein US20_C0004G0011 [Candidatus Pacebacteria bacterium GW2011_GWF1_36_5]KKQ88540.1 MAG: hypothetical protein UT13_C0001G0187 [Candidatus Pacebacteria bacterium GW2011_GWF2_38_9]HAZ73326.1 hypothetical protein [Candidatus Paceibacterota bacterium]
MTKSETFILKDEEETNFSSNPDIDVLRQSIYDHLIESGNISVLEAYFKNPKDIIFFSPFNRPGNTLVVVEQEPDPKGFILDPSKKLALKTVDGQTKILRNVKDFTALVKSNNSRLEGEKFINNSLKSISNKLKRIFKG